jgi:hypothetical protein
MIELNNRSMKAGSGAASAICADACLLALHAELT